MALSLGGDGTFLKTAERVGNKHIPILGINTGRLGFLADVAENEIDEAVAELFNGDYRIEERSLLQLKADALPVKFWPFALNEAAILKRDSSSMITIRKYLSGRWANCFDSYRIDRIFIERRWPDTRSASSELRNSTGCSPQFECPSFGIQ